MSFEPIIIETADEPAEVEQTHLFSIDGVEYFMPAELPPSVGLQAMEMVRSEGELVANAWMLEEVLGAEAYHALIACRDLTKVQMRQIADIVADQVMGALGDESEGNGQGPNRAARRVVSRATSSNGHSAGPGSSTTKRTSTRTSGASTGSPRSKRKTN